MEITQQEFQQRVAENTAELQKQITDRTRDVTKFHGFDALAGELDPDVVMHKSPDIWVAALIGCLAILAKKTGADGMTTDSIKYREAEFKSCYTYVSPDVAFKTPEGTIYFTKDVNMWGSHVKISNTSIAASKFKASFDPRADKVSKDRDTYLVAKDVSSGKLIDCYMLTGDKVVKYLQTSRDIKLGSFINHGVQVPLQVPTLTYAAWHSSILPTLQTKSRSKNGTPV